MAENSLLKFLYVNWHGREHEYVIEPEKIEYGKFGADTCNHWYLHGMVVTRDGDAREDMGDNRRRSFQIGKIQVISEVDG